MSSSNSQKSNIAGTVNSLINLYNSIDQNLSANLDDLVSENNTVGEYHLLFLDFAQNYHSERQSYLERRSELLSPDSGLKNTWNGIIALSAVAGALVGSFVPDYVLESLEVTRDPVLFLNYFGALVGAGAGAKISHFGYSLLVDRIESKNAKKLNSLDLEFQETRSGLVNDFKEQIKGQSSDRSGIFKRNGLGNDSSSGFRRRSISPYSPKK